MKFYIQAIDKNGNPLFGKFIDGENERKTAYEYMKKTHERNNALRDFKLSIVNHCVNTYWLQEVQTYSFMF